MLIKRLKASKLIESSFVYPCRVVLLELGNRASKYSTHIEVFPSEKESFMIHGGYGNDLNEETEMFNERVKYYCTKEDIDFKPDENFVEI